MPRNRKFIRSPGYFHVGARTNNQEWFGMPLPELWSLSSDLLGFTARAFQLRVGAYVLMSNHYHLLIEAPESNLPEAMNYFQRELSKMLGRQLNRKNHIFGGPFFASHIGDPVYIETVYRYIYRNPVEAGMATRVEGHPYSTLHNLFGADKSFLSVLDPLGIHEQTEGILSWLNTSYADPDQPARIQNGLRSAEFQWKTGRSKRNIWTDDLSFSRSKPKKPRT